MSKRALKFGIGFAGLILVLSGCGNSDNPSVGGPSRTIPITMTDNQFSPADIAVKPGEAVRFVVANKGTTDHEFLVGTESEQKKLGKDMQAGGGMAGHQMGDTAIPGVEVKPGETKDYAFQAPKSGALIYGCHVPGHYESGMRGTIRVSE